jgi:radical SAM protein with 4Fe4S-binding SPASM domain
MDYLAVPASKIYNRSDTHQHCLSPWQTLPVNVEGDITICDCLPETKIGNLLYSPFSKIWNGIEFKAHRRKMRSSLPPAACRRCPRF